MEVTQNAALKGGDIVSAGSAQFIYLNKESDKRPELPEPGGPAFLVDAQNRRAYPLNRRVVQIGREIGCNIVLKDTSVSRFHADIRAEGGQHVIYSMGSGGTTVGGESVKHPRMLRDAMQAGFSGYLTKDTQVSRLVNAMRTTPASAIFTSGNSTFHRK